MNKLKDVNYNSMANEYFHSAQQLKKIIDNMKENRVSWTNIKEYNSKLLSIRSMYNDCILAGTLLVERAEQYKK